MHMSRLLETVYILLERKNVTARELAEHFEVSPRTIYRDIDTLSAAGIPIFTHKGRGGGIKLLDNYIINKSMISDKEQVEILASLQGLNALNVAEVEPVLNKLSVLFDRSSTNWVEVDFAEWGSGKGNQAKFNLLKTTILQRRLIQFDYYSSYKEKTTREVEPLKLVFKGQSWYVYAFCRNKADYRVFKLGRIKNLTETGQTFQRDLPDDVLSQMGDYNDKIVHLVLRIDSRVAYRVFDEFDQERVEQNAADGSFIVRVSFPEGDWVHGYILSFGDAAEVLEPLHVREEIAKIFGAGVKKYI